MPLVSFYDSRKHQKISSFLIYQLFADMSLSTVGYLRELCLMLLVKRRVRFTSENSYYKKIFFFLQMSASIFMHCAANKGFKDDICMIEVVICILV